MFSFLKRLFPPSTNYNELLERGAIIIDVRTPQEFDNGHIKGSKNIPLNLVKGELGKIKSWDKPIITVCQSGGRSNAAKSLLKAAGVEVYNGGGWMGLKSKL
jgi:phage shock protein E